MDELTESRLAEIERRVKAATPGPWKWADAGDASLPPNGYDDELVGPDGGHVHSDGSARGEYGPDIDVRGPDAQFIAHARQDVPALLDALKVAHEGIAVMMQDSDAYQRGKADGRREERDACVRVLRAAVADEVVTGVADKSRLYSIANAMGGYDSIITDDLPPPLPPDVVRRENERLREALLALIAGVEGSYVVSDFMRGKIEVAREALKGDDSGA